MNKDIISQELQSIEEICARYPQLTVELVKNIDQIKTDINTFSAYVPFIGLFSAGKSALLNYYMGMDILPVDQPATTSLATELQFGEKKQFVLVDEKGKEHLFEKMPSNAEEANSTTFSSYSKAICFVPSKKLQELNGVVPVDMPGTDSGIEAHTQALFQYLYQGMAFVVVVDAASGTLPPTIGQILQNISETKKRVILVVHKSDKYSEEKISSVSALLLEQIESILGRKATLLVTSILNPETPEILHNALSALDVQRLLSEEFAPTVNQYSIRLANQLSTLSQGLNEDSSALDSAIFAASQAQKDAAALFEKNKRKVQNDFSENAVRKAVAEIGNDLEANIEVLCDAAIEGEHSLSIRLGHIVESGVIRSLRQSIEMQLNAVAIDLESLDSLNIEALQGAIKDATQGTTQLLSIALRGMTEGGKLYKILTTTMAVMTNVIAPIVEILIIFLPDIINLLSDQEGKRRQKIKAQLRSRLFPDIRAKLEESLRSELPELGQRALEAVEADFKTILDEREAALREALLQKDDYEADLEQRRNTYAKDVQQLNSIAARMVVQHG